MYCHIYHIMLGVSDCLRADFLRVLFNYKLYYKLRYTAFTAARSTQLSNLRGMVKGISAFGLSNNTSA